MLIDESTVGLIMVVAIILFAIIISSFIDGNMTQKAVYGTLITAIILAIMLFVISEVIPNIALP